MKDFKEIMDQLKLYISTDCQKKVKDKDLAVALEMSPSRFATLKKRETIPYETILKFCEKEDISCSRLFFN